MVGIVIFEECEFCKLTTKAHDDDLHLTAKCRCIGQYLAVGLCLADAIVSVPAATLPSSLASSASSLGDPATTFGDRFEVIRAHHNHGREQGKTKAWALSVLNSLSAMANKVAQQGQSQQLPQNVNGLHDHQLPQVCCPLPNN